jgi:hypothetical protein
MDFNYGQGTPDKPSQGYILFITATVMVIVAGFFVIGRLLLRWHKKLFGMDDYTIVGALVCFPPSDDGLQSNASVYYFGWLSAFANSW